MKSFFYIFFVLIILDLSGMSQPTKFIDRHFEINLDSTFDISTQNITLTVIGLKKNYNADITDHPSIDTVKIIYSSNQNDYFPFMLDTTTNTISFPSFLTDMSIIDYFLLEINFSNKVLRIKLPNPWYEKITIGIIPNIEGNYDLTDINNKYLIVKKTKSTLNVNIIDITGLKKRN